MSSCITCGKTPKRSTYRFCSNKCQAEQRYNTYIQKWKLNQVSGERGVKARNISAHLKRYLFSKYNKCSFCNWSEINPSTGRVPLEIDHIDGNASNNSEENLRLLCPNCHSLIPSFRNLNTGKGREWRRQIKKEK